MLEFLSKLFDNNEKQIVKYRKVVEEVNALEDKYKDMSFEEMRSITNSWKKELTDMCRDIPAEDMDSIKSSFNNGKKILSKKEIEIQSKLLEIRSDAFA